MAMMVVRSARRLRVFEFLPTRILDFKLKSNRTTFWVSWFVRSRAPTERFNLKTVSGIGFESETRNRIVSKDRDRNQETIIQSGDETEIDSKVFLSAIGRLSADESSAILGTSSPAAADYLIIQNRRRTISGDAGPVCETPRSQRGGR
ncbi:hypothetical protein EVAR_36118_1 [Eumeta japonica]|uniref:Uncharacterized protein n=1 Tax=Eumeta variegata TaxID=151549 RepID=A0A4C1X152_EUMVA|nr:hypothetical protein EVAR_36118_1 [Eumeta japonica]